MFNNADKCVHYFGEERSIFSAAGLSSICIHILALALEIVYETHTNLMCVLMSVLLGEHTQSHSVNFQTGFEAVGQV